MKIGFDGRYAEGDLVGVGNYIKSLLQGLDKRGVDCVIFYSRKPKFKLQGKNTKSIILPAKNRYIFEQILLPQALKKEKVEIYHALGNVGVPLVCPVPSVLTVHDIIPLEIEGYFSFSPFPALSKLSYLFRLKTSLSKAMKIVTVSNYVKGEIKKKLSVPANKIQTIYSGRPIPGKGGTLPVNLKNQKYILNHGGMDIRKNLGRLIEAFALVHKNHGDIKLVVTGENIIIREQLDKKIADLGLENSVVFTGYVDGKTLTAIIKSATLICYPTLSEGFGFPVLEGFGAGVPVISSNTSSIPEISGGAALLINPQKVDEIVNAIEKVLRGGKTINEMVLKGRARYNMFNWKESVNEYIDLYNSI